MGQGETPPLLVAPDRPEDSASCLDSALEYREATSITQDYPELPDEVRSELPSGRPLSPRSRAWQKRLSILMSVPFTKHSGAILGFSLAIAVAWLTSSGCAARQSGSFRVLTQGRKSVLIPPGPARSADNPRRFTIRTPVEREDCALQERGIRVETRGRSLRVSIEERALAAGAPGWLTRWVDTFSDNGCLPRDQARSFTRRVMESFPLELSHTYSVAFGRPRTAEFVDFHPGQKLKIVGPVFREGTEPGQRAILSADATQANGPRGLQIEVRASPELTGYEESWYIIQTKPNGVLQITHDHTKFFEDGEATQRDVPEGTVFDLVPASRYIRMVYLTRVADSRDHDVLFLVATTRSELEDRFRLIQGDPEQCFAPDNKGWCRIAPSELAFNLYVTVSLNGIEVPVIPGTPIGRFLRETMRGSGGDTKQDLQIQRPHANRLAMVEFDRSNQAILALPLLGGEQISLPSVRRE